MEELKLVYLQWLSYEREKHIWEDRPAIPWDETMGRMYLLKAHEAIEDDGPDEDVLADFEQALSFLAGDGVSKEYYYRALADKALVQCFLEQYKAGLSTIDQALTLVHPQERDSMLDNRAAILVLAGAYSEALALLQAQLDQSPKDESLRFNLATCLLHMERYDDAIAAYEQVVKKDSHYYGDIGLKAARLGKQPDWANL